MKSKPFFVILGAVLIGLTGAVWAQRAVDNPDWKEVDVPPPPAFDSNKLIAFDVSPNASLVYGVDPASIRISNSDSVVRYVMVATSASGAKNVMYEGIR
ncbi:MAG: CNP1-like family protein, partial [Polaromonas sp.]|nr:CNP1-like family protein [Polaromonas sp.]